MQSLFLLYLSRSSNLRSMVAERGFDTRTSGICAQHASTAQLCYHITKENEYLVMLVDIREISHKEEVHSRRARGVVYFADDDNVYDLRLFEKIRWIKNVGIFAVGFTGGSWLELPKVENGTVVGFNVVYEPRRRFATDMAGFAVNLNRILDTDVRFHSGCKAGEFEGCFLSQLVEPGDLEPVGLDFEVGEPKEVFVYHISTLRPVVTGYSHGYEV